LPAIHLPMFWEFDMKSNKKLKDAGFTLLELMMTIVIVAVLVSLAGPNFRILIQNNRQVSHTNEFITSMHQARSEAVKRGSQVRITATTTTDTANEWGPGWSVWVDLDSDNTLDTNERLRNAIDHTDSITLNSNGNVTEYRYDPDGSLALGAPDTLDICDSSRNGESRRRVSFAPNGRVSLDTSGNCP